MTGAALEAPGKLVVRVVDPAAEARLRASDSFSAFVGDARRCDLTVVVELKGEPIPSGGR